MSRTFRSPERIKFAQFRFLISVGYVFDFSRDERIMGYDGAISRNSGVGKWKKRRRNKRIRKQSIVQE